MNTEQAIEKLKELQDGCLLNIDSWAVEPYIAAIKSAIAALREKAERENPKPLTLEEVAELAKAKRRADKAVKVLERIKRDINEQDKIYIHIADYFGRCIYIDEEETMNEH